ncbi:hypothetical protein [Methylotenera sp.]|uniref:hypothetical protein n=1 Tax=Methylotenera sp. TaxID=2051956 RepID=UPI002730B1EE|nr:hypothetical protein [Methylotenera sp.]MDP2229539.1 hypothetical protein [Methylotenera sp.]MDP3140917.1 hypothetical protein [Methylotenera sp.]
MKAASSLLLFCLADTAFAVERDTSTGTWKAVVPKNMHGEFDSHDPIGVIAGQKIKADCSLNWVDPDDKKIYCFSSGTSLLFFLEMPKTKIKKAREAYENSQRDKTPE